MLANTQAVTQNTAQLGTSGPSTANKVGSTLEDTLGIGLGLSPLISGLLSLFGGGGGSSQAAAPTPFALPPSVAVNAGGSAEPASTSSRTAAGVSARARGAFAETPPSIGYSDYGAGAGDGQPVISRSQQRHCAGGAAGDAAIERVERCDSGGVEVANFPTLKTGAVAQYPSDRTQQFSTQVFRFLDGSEQRFPGYGSALRQWTIRLDLLDEAELTNLQSFPGQRRRTRGKFFLHRSV